MLIASPPGAAFNHYISLYSGLCLGDANGRQETRGDRDSAHEKRVERRALIRVVDAAARLGRV
jgi:hypothetical protein